MGCLLFIFFLFICGLLLLVDRGSAADVCVLGAAGPDLRILPLDALITWGLRSIDGNGYCKALRDQLRWKGFEVNMVGSRANGSMVDNDVEARSRDTILDITAAAVNLVGYKPNMVLINAGTNNCREDWEIPSTGDRMRALIKSLVDKEDMANSLIILLTLLPSLDANTSQNVPIVNKQYRNLVTTMRGEGVNIILADLNPVKGQPNHGWIRLPTDFNPDSTHPNDRGYRKLAMICGEDNGIYYHDSESAVKILAMQNSERTMDNHSNQIFFARLWVRDLDDMVTWDDETGKMLNDAGFVLAGYLNVNNNCNPAGVYWVDINSNSLDDFICIGLDRNAFASVNNSNGTKSDPLTFTYLGKWKQNKGYPQAQVRVGNMDGDGRADYCVLEKNRDMSCWRNRWINDAPKYWQPLRKRFTGKGIGNLAGLWVDNNGATTTYTNSRSCKRGKEGNRLNIAWRQGFHKGASSGPTHPDIEGQNNPIQDNIHFTRIFGSSQDFGLESRKDYVWNMGSSATKVKGETYSMTADSNQYCNIIGYNNSQIDYIWILSKGDIQLYPNKGLFWGPNKVIFDPKAKFGQDLDRQDLHLADFDGDRANQIKETGDFNWAHQEVNSLVCAEKHGIGFFDQPVHMADITSNRKADYLYIKKDGQTSGYLHWNNGSWEHKDQIKFAENHDHMIHTDKFTGDGTVWYNHGEQDISRSCTYFPDLNSNSAADMHLITDLLENTATTYYNSCGSKDSVGDNDNINYPDLSLVQVHD
ncbi:hypothetical protein BDW59DRAFT_171436 [Aspergillus cavernicola]|uniref:SGNH hydrolase-type esterase domain-containing protein n=1 Tax=Aspergillus cavernicola TaxID=176166 RepID=A0ABR4IJS3_9EURO